MAGVAAVFRFTRNGPTDAALRVYYAIGGTATNIVNYAHIGTSVNIPAGASFADVTIKPVLDNVHDQPQTVMLKISKRDTYETAEHYFATAHVYMGDATPPTAKLSARTLTTGAAFYQFSVKYTDNRRMDPATVGSGNIQVTGPNKYSPVAKLISKYWSLDGTAVLAVYQIPAPNGHDFGAADNGTYTVKLLANQVKDAEGNVMAAATLGTFGAQLPAT